MTRFFSIISLLLIISIFHSGCIKSFEESDSATPRTATCDECHTFPGSNYCKIDTITADGITASTVDGNTVTSCVLCHMGVVKLDSTKTEIHTDSIDTIITIYHDLIFNSNNTWHIATDSLHTDGKVDANFGQCTKCHGYPPNKDGHNYHIFEKSKECIECHLLSVQRKLVDYGGRKRYETIKTAGLYRDSIPIPDTDKHLNALSGEVAFKLKAEGEIASDPGNDTLYLWDPKERSCSNNKCHRPFPLEHYKKELWKESK